MWYASYMAESTPKPPDIDPAKTWIVSDTHFGHTNIVGFCHRPEDHDQIIMEEWARYVPDDATVLHLGDLCWRGNAWFKNMIAPHLTGERKLLIRGNHDKGRYSFYRQSGFKLVRPFSIFYQTESAYTEVSFSHYPVEGVVPEGHLHLHGHIHNNGYERDRFVPFKARQINLSVEQTKFRPVHLQTLLDEMLA